MRAKKKILTTGAIAALGFGYAFGDPIYQPAADEVRAPDQQQEYGATERRDLQAAERPRTQDRQAQARTSESFRASTLMGSRVQNPQGERLGTVTDLAVDLESGEVSYVIVSAGGILAGIGGELRPVPADSFQVRALEGRMPGVELILDVAADRWDQAPSIQRDQMAQLGRQEDRIREFYGEAGAQRQREFGTQDRDRTDDRVEATDADRDLAAQEDQPRYRDVQAGERQDQSAQATIREEEREYGARDDQLQAQARQDQPRDTQAQVRQDQPSDHQAQARQDQPRDPQAQSRQEGAEKQYHMVSRLIGESVRIGEGQEEVGQVDDLVVNLSEGQISMVVIQPRSGFWETANEDYAVSPESLQRHAAGHFQLDIDREQLQTAEMISERDLQQGTETGEQVYRVRVSPGSPEIFGGRDQQQQHDQHQRDER